jgi:hypothetical protein
MLQYFLKNIHYTMSLINMHSRCKLILHEQPMKMMQSSISDQECGVKWGDVAEIMMVIDWVCNVFLFYLLISIKL